MSDAEKDRRRREERKPAQEAGRRVLETVLINALRRVEEAEESPQHVIAAFNNYV